MTGSYSAFRDRATMGLFILSAVLWPFFLVLSHRGVAPALLVMGAAAAMRGDIWRVGFKTFLLKPDWHSPLVRCALFFFLFCFWIAISGLWAPVPVDGSLALNPLTPSIAGGAVIWTILQWPAQTALRLQKVFAIGVVVAVIGLFFEAITGGLLRQLTPPDVRDPAQDIASLGRGATIAAISLLPGLVLVYQGRNNKPNAYLTIFALSAMALFAFWRFGVSTTIIGVLLSMVTFILVRIRPNTGLIFVAWGFVAAAFLAPVAAFLPAEELFQRFGGSAPVSWLQRLVIWQYAGEAAIGCFPLGCGADYARAIHAAKETFVTPHWPEPLPVMPLHPHNLFLQIWLEAGIVGAVLFAAAILNGAMAIMRTSLEPIVKALIAGCAIVVFVSALFEMSLWQVWRNAAPAYAGVMIALIYRS